MASRGKQFKALSPKKVSRRKRTPRCETCGKRDGEELGGEGQGKVRLKLCARCRGVAYCGMECQKRGWKVHREVCVQYANAAELPAPSPLVNHKISGAGARGRRKVIYGGAVGTVGATPRQRENAPTRHPFFGRQESSSERDPRGATAVPVRKQKEQYMQQKTPRRQQHQHQHQHQHQQQHQHQHQHQHPRHEQPSNANDEDICPSPPVMQRLSFPGGVSRARPGSRSGSAGGGNKRPRSTSSSKSPPPAQHRPSSRGSVAAAVKAAASRVRRSSHAADNGKRWSGSRSPPPPPSPADRAPVRRESAPLYQVALEKSKRRAAAGLAASSGAGASSRRGPPPPYASVAHRAETIKQASPSTAAAGTSAGGGLVTAAAGTKAAERIAVTAPAAEPPSRRSSSEGAGGQRAARVPPPLPPRTAVSLGGMAASPPPPGSLSVEPPAGHSKTSSTHAREEGEEDQRPIAGENGPTAAKDEGADAPAKSPSFEKEVLVGEKKAWPDGPQLVKREEEEQDEDRKEFAGLGEEDDTDEPTPERRAEGAQLEDVFDVPRGVGTPPLANESTAYSASGSATAAVEAADTAAIPERPSLSKDSSRDLSQDSAAGSTTGQESSTVRVRPTLAKYSTGSLSQDSAAASITGQEGGTAGPLLRSLSKDPTNSCSNDSAAVATTRHESSTALMRPSMAKDWSHDSAAASITGQEGGTAGPVQPSLSKDPTNSCSHDSAAGSTTGHESSTALVRPSMAKDLSHDSAAASLTGQEGSTAGPVQPSLSKDSSERFSHDSAAGSPARHGELPLPMEPPTPILPPSATSNASGLLRASNDGVFDSCPPSDGFGSKSGSHRSLSVGTPPQFHSMPLVLAAKGIAAAAAAAWSGEHRRSSPRPRPPVSPGPAALSDSFRSRKQSSADPDDVFMPKISPSAVAAIASFGREKKSASAPPSRALSARSLSTGSRRASPRSGMTSPRSPPFVPAVELSPQGKLQTLPRVPGPRPTDTAVFYQERLGAPPAGAAGLPPPSTTYLGRPDGFSVHVLVASAPTRADLAATRGALPAAAGGKDKSPRLFYSFEDRGRVAAALEPGDVILVTPGRYEARAWGLQCLIASVEIVGAGAAGDCVIYNNSPSADSSSPPYSGLPEREHYLVGVMGGALCGAGAEGGASGVPEVMGKDDVDDDSDSGFEDGALGGAAAASSITSFGGRAVRVRLANLTLEQGSGYRGAVYQLGRDSHLEMEGCTVVCSQGGVNIDQGTCAISDSTISGSEAFGVHIGGEGAVEHCLIRGCGRGGGRGRGNRAAAEEQGAAEAFPTSTDVEVEDDGTDVNLVEGMPAISFLQSSRVRVRFNVIRDNAGHSLQCRDAPLPGGDGKYAMLARRAEAEAAEKLRSWLGSAAVLLREHLQGQHREGSIVSEGNQCKRNRGCDRVGCGGGTWTGTGNDRRRRGAAAEESIATNSCPATGEASEEAARRGELSAACEETTADGGCDRGTGDGGLEPSGGRDRESDKGVGRTGQTCAPTAEEEGLPLPAAMTLRFLAAMDEGYVGSRREEIARLRRMRSTMRHKSAG